MDITINDVIKKTKTFNNTKRYQKLKGQKQKNNDINLFKKINEIKYNFNNENTALSLLLKEINKFPSKYFTTCKIIFKNDFYDGFIISCGFIGKQIIIKTSNNPHEIVCGIYGINKIKDKIINFPFNYYGFVKNYNPTIGDEIANLDFSINKGKCYYNIIEYINGLPFKNFFNEKLYKYIPMLMIQLFSAMNYANEKINFCHNDLHIFNIIIENKKDTEIPIYVNNKFEKITSDYILRIIDFEFSYFQTKNYNSKMYAKNYDLGQRNYWIADIVKFLASCYDECNNDELKKLFSSIWNKIFNKISIKDFMKMKNNFFIFPYFKNISISRNKFYNECIKLLTLYDLKKDFNCIYWNYNTLLSSENCKNIEKENLLNISLYKLQKEHDIYFIEKSIKNLTNLFKKTKELYKKYIINWEIILLLLRKYYYGNKETKNILLNYKIKTKNMYQKIIKNNSICDKKKEIIIFYNNQLIDL